MSIKNNSTKVPLRFFKGQSKDLELVPLTDGYVYFCEDTGAMFIDFLNDGGILERKQINRNDLLELRKLLDDKISKETIELFKEEIANLYQTKEDKDLLTEAKTIIGAINELYNKEDKVGLNEEEVRAIVTAATQDKATESWVEDLLATTAAETDSKIENATKDFITANNVDNKIDVAIENLDTQDSVNQKIANAINGLQDAEQVQKLIEENINNIDYSNLQTVTDNNLSTFDKTIVGAINELDTNTDKLNQEMPLIARVSISFENPNMGSIGTIIENGISLSSFNRKPIIGDIFTLHAKDTTNKIMYLICKITSFTEDYASFMITAMDTVYNAIAITMIDNRSRSNMDSIMTLEKKSSSLEQQISNLHNEELPKYAQKEASNTFTESQYFKNIYVDGDIIQQGQTYETHAEQLYTKDNYIILRDEAIVGLNSDEYVGFQAKKYDGENDGRLVFDNKGIARVGDVGDEQPLATRDEASSLTNGNFVKWDSISQRIVDADYNKATIENRFITIETSYTTLNNSITTAATPNTVVKRDAVGKSYFGFSAVDAIPSTGTSDPNKFRELVATMGNIKDLVVIAENLDAAKVNKTDQTLITADKTVIGALNEVKADANYLATHKTDIWTYDGYVGTLWMQLETEGAKVNAATLNAPYTLVYRDVNGRSRVEGPVDNYDIANKGYVDSNKTHVYAHCCCCYIKVDGTDRYFQFSFYSTSPNRCTGFNDLVVLMNKGGYAVNGYADALMINIFNVAYQGNGVLQIIGTGASANILSVNVTEATFALSAYYVSEV